MPQDSKSRSSSMDSVLPWLKSRTLQKKWLLKSIPILTLGFVGIASSQEKEVIPHNQSAPPNRPYTAQEAISKMTVPDGFTVEVVAAEPQIVNPIAMTFDERGRIWITESLEYPRSDAGPGRDRIKILEDTDGDGAVDKTTIFAEGLNIPSGIALGHGGVWVANSPDILFMQDTDGDDKADKTEVVVSGFGRTDTHELPNSLVWGPDGWLYGLNGVFNYSKVVQGGKTWDFTVAMFRIHPRTRQFELWAEGTSNPWGIAWNEEGHAFLSACVIDHLWHLTESGYYHRQAGPYPPNTWKIESIVDYKHQKAAYCGIHFFDSPAYPEEYRNRLYMGNIHGNCINVDSVERNGSTYKGTGHPDFLSANDVWFMPVAQKTGPDGSLYVLDWYDRYHCYQDARRDPEGIDRLKGRLYRIRYKETPRAGKFDLAKLSSSELVEKLGDENVYFRDAAQVILAGRSDAESETLLRSTIQNRQLTKKHRHHAMWALISRGALDEKFAAELLKSDLAGIRAWTITALGNQKTKNDELLAAVRTMAADEAPDVQVQLAIAANKLWGEQGSDVLIEILASAKADPLLPKIIWANLLPHLQNRSGAFFEALAKSSSLDSELTEMILPRAVEMTLESGTSDPQKLALLIQSLLRNEKRVGLGIGLLRIMLSGVQDGTIGRELYGQVYAKLTADLNRFQGGIGNLDSVATHRILGAALIGEKADIEACAEGLFESKIDEETKSACWSIVLLADSSRAPELLRKALQPKAEFSPDLQGKMINGLLLSKDDRVADLLIQDLPKLSAELQPKVVEVVTSRDAWANKFLAAIAEKKLNAAMVNVNQIRKLSLMKDEKVKEHVRQLWGQVRLERSADRDRVISKIDNLLQAKQGDALAGEAVFQKVCGQCHKIYGKGMEVGPDLTGNGRGSYSQFLSNVLDPSLVIGESYQATIVETKDGQTLAGLVTENSDQRVVLKTQGGKEVVVAKEDVEAIQRSSVSLMPEKLEEGLSEKELLDLFAFLLLDKHPSEKDAKWIPGAPQPKK